MQDRRAEPDYRSIGIDPPRRFTGIVRQVGPGLVIAGAVVGAGELVAAPTLGARVGFAALWLVILSCVVKIIIQTELGRFTVSSGQTAFHALNRVPGPRFRGNWIVWMWLGLFAGNIVTLGGLLGSIGQSLALIIPGVDPFVWQAAAVVLTVGLLMSGRYGVVETVTMTIVGLFTITAVISLAGLHYTPYAVSWADIRSGLVFSLPAAGAGTAFAVLGFTGVGAGDLIMYPFWCLEKGYARFAGHRDGSDIWAERVRGWIRVSQVDVVLSSLVITLTTVVFYLLGAAVLGEMGDVPGGFGLIEALSAMFTASLGRWAFLAFSLGAFFVLFSTFFVNIAGIPRLLADFLEIQGILKYRERADRDRWVRRFVILLPLAGEAVYLIFREPLSMVLVSGICQAVLMPVIGFGLIYLRHAKLDRRLAPSLAADVWMAFCCLLIVAVSLYPLLVKLSDVF